MAVFLTFNSYRYSEYKYIKMYYKLNFTVIQQIIHINTYFWIQYVSSCIL